MADETEHRAGGTSGLVASDAVAGSDVRRRDGTRIGRVERLMIDKASGRVAYAVMSFGGLMGFGEDHYTLPWSALDYDPARDAFLVDLPEDELRDAPRRTERGTDPSDEPDWQAHVHRYFNGDVQEGEPIRSASHEAKDTAPR